MANGLDYSIMDSQSLPTRIRESFEIPPSGSVLVVRKGEKIKDVKYFKNGSLLDEIEETNKKLKLDRKKAEKIIKKNFK